MNMDSEPSLLRFTVLIVFLGVALYGVWFFQSSQEVQNSPGTNRQVDIAQVAPGEISAIDRLLSEPYTDMQPITEPPEITGDEDADERIRNIAVQRGHQLWPLYSGELEKIEDIPVSLELMRDWQGLALRAEESDAALVLEVGFISFEEARDEFVDRLQDKAHEEIGREYSVEQISGGTADAAINAVLREYPIPGFTPHHSGYVLRVSSESEDFLVRNAREFNFAVSDDQEDVSSTFLVWQGEKSNR